MAAILTTWEFGMDVADWLRSRGLQVHAAALAENGVDAALLADLTDEDLKDLGVAKLADRKRLLSAIVDLASDGAKTGRHIFSGPFALDQI